jgi:histidyl-tRNA synthetase
MQQQGLPGFREFFPDDLALRNHIFATWRAVAQRYAFEEYDGPPLEPLELYTGKSGEEIVEQLYAFKDKGDRDVTLRPEMTPTLARMVSERAQALKKPIRWFSVPQLFRYERQQRGRLREHFQLNMDIIGEASPLADAELLAAGIDVLRAFGFGPGDVRARVSDRRLLRALLEGGGVKAAALPAAYAAVDKVEREDKKKLEAQLAKAGFSAGAVKTVLEVAQIRGLDAAKAAARGVGGAEAALAPLLEVTERVQAMGLGEFVQVDLSIVRGLAYYTGIVFELFSTQEGLRAICGGGRYDGLLKVLSGGSVDLPALGFGMGDVVLGELLKARGLAPKAASRVDVFLVAIGADDVGPVLTLAHRLREAGFATEYSLKPESPRKQLERAGGRQARCAVSIGPEERAAGTVRVRFLGTGQEEQVAEAMLDDVLRTKLEAHG